MRREAPRQRDRRRAAARRGSQLDRLGLAGRPSPARSPRAPAASSISRSNRRAAGARDPPSPTRSRAFGLAIAATAAIPGADVGEKRHDETRQLAERRLEVERARQARRWLRARNASLARALGGRARSALLGERDALLRLPLRLLREQIQLDEDLDLRAQDLGHDRRHHEVDGAERIRLRRCAPRRRSRP